MDKLEQITERLRQQRPMVEDEEAFVDGIMELIDEPLPRIPTWLKVVRAASSLAAAFLLILYVWQQLDVMDDSTASHPSHIVQSTPDQTIQKPEAMDRQTTIDAIDRYLSERAKRQEMKKHSIRYNYARL